MLNEKSRNWLKLVPYAIYLMNNQVSSRTGFTPTELFLGRPGFNFEFPCVSEGNPKVDEWLTEQKRIADLCRSLVEKKRSKENRTKNRKRKEAIYQIGDWVLVHHTRFKAGPCNTLDSPYFGPFLVTDVAEGSVWIKTHPKYGGLVEVGYPQLKHYDVLDDLYDWEEDLQESLEAAAEDLAADPMDEDEELPPMEDDGSLRMPERDISLSRPTVPTPTAVEARPKRISSSLTTKPTPDTVHSPTPGQLHVESIQLACTCALCCCYALCMKREELLIFHSFWLRCFVVMMQYVRSLGRSQLFGSQIKVGAPTWQLACANSRVGAPTAKLARQLGAPTPVLTRAKCPILPLLLHPLCIPFPF